MFSNERVGGWVILLVATLLLLLLSGPVIVELRAMWGRGQVGTLAALQDMEASLPFLLLGMDSDNGGEFLNYHVLNWLQKRPRPVLGQ
jgi:hypothetical protein